MERARTAEPAELTAAVADVEVEYEGTVTRFVLPNRDVDHIQRHIFNSRRFYELDMLRHCATLLEPGQLVVDVGANIGNHTLFFANVCGARVVAFEPNPASFEILRNNVAVGGLEGRVRLEQQGLGRSRGHAELKETSAANMGHTTLQLLDEGGSVRVTALDDVELPAPPRLIKIDVEGMELDVLRGAEKTIRAHHPFLYVEAETKAALSSLLAMLEPWGYRPVVQFNATPTVLFAHTTVDMQPGDAQLALGLHSIATDFAHQAQRIDSTRSAITELVARQRALGEQVEALSIQVQGRQLLDEATLRALRRVEAEVFSLRQLAQATSAGPRPPETGSRASSGPRRRGGKPPARGALGRKIRKFQRDPEQFFEDSKSVLVRTLVKRAYGFVKNGK